MPEGLWTRILRSVQSGRAHGTMYVRAKANFVDQVTEKERTATVNASSYCREILVEELYGQIYRMRSGEVMKNGWGAREIFETPRISTEPARISINISSGMGFKAENTRALRQMCDVIVGLPALLLSPNRPPGEWWNVKEKPDRAFHYCGVDSSFIFHPALVSIILGLLRQSVYLHREGEHTPLMEKVPRLEVVQALTTADHELAGKLVRKATRWIISTSTSAAFPLGRGNQGAKLLFLIHNSLMERGFDRTFGNLSRRCCQPYGGRTGVRSYFNKARVAKLSE